MSNSLWPHGLQHTVFPCPSPSTELHDAIQSSHPLLSPSPPAFNFPQHQGLFQWVSSSHQMAKVLELQQQSFQWIFRIDFLYSDWFDLSAVKGTFKNILQDYSLKATVLWCSAFFMVQLLPSSNNARDDSTQEHHQMIDNEIWLITFLAAKDGEALIQSA